LSQAGALHATLVGEKRQKPMCIAIRFWTMGLLVMAIGVLTAGCQRQAPADTSLTKVVLQADWYPQPEHGGFFTALAKGYYKQEGLAVTIQPLGPYLSVEKQVASGAAQFGMGSSDRTLEAIAEGQPLIAVAATLQSDPQGIMVRKDSPIHSFADLNGHTVAIKTGSTWWEYIEKRYGLNSVHEVPAMMNVANFVADPEYVQQAFATSEPYFAQKAGIPTRVLLTKDAGYNPYRVMFTTRECLQEHPQVVGQFVRASLRGWKDYLNDPALAHAMISKLNPALTPEWMQFSWQALRDGHFVTGDDPSGAQVGQMDPKRWQAMYEQLVDLKVVETRFDPSSAYTLRFVANTSGD
jgi:NitT/TauT family transport system substrate-binding protein